ncbi:peptidoglycan-binding protein LysM [Acinetobacter boissieri]|uniref:Potassium binding protein Kbp n=1 Tax=Acinetobacter boissieri TaxID=1219383 RepID=A0A1G6H8U1_9GAMM|nr:peptidoglycan-binding protein LysM [Acinetobacter boissieri]SDB90709.1 BON domain-containing protein [Acinetobacter boissieri]
MGIFDFVKGIGDKLQGKTEQSEPTTTSTPAPTEPSAQEVANQLLSHIQGLGLAIGGLSVNYNSDTDTAIIHGEAQSQADKEKVVLAAGNVAHVAQVDDQMTVAETAEEQSPSQFYTVQSGDTLSKISKQFYGDSNKYNSIFEANQPLLKDVNSIYPGQVLRIPE